MHSYYIHGMFLYIYICSFSTFYAISISHTTGNELARERTELARAILAYSQLVTPGSKLARERKWAKSFSTGLL